MHSINSYLNYVVRLYYPQLKLAWGKSLEEDISWVDMSVVDISYMSVVDMSYMSVVDISWVDMNLGDMNLGDMSLGDTSLDRLDRLHNLDMSS